MRNTSMLQNAIDALNRTDDIIDMDENCDPIVSALESIAAALIANVEQRPQFVQVPDGTRFPVDAIKEIEPFTVNGIPGVNVYLTYRTVQLKGTNATAFLAWHEQHADVVRLDVPQEAE